MTYDDRLMIPTQDQKGDKGDFHDILLFDGEGRFLTRSTSDIPTLKKENFFDLLSGEEQKFFHMWSRLFSTGSLLLDTSRGMALVFCRLYPTTGVFVAIMFHTSREAMRHFWQNGVLDNTRVSPQLVAKTPPRKEGRQEEICMIEKKLGVCAEIFDLASYSVSEIKGRQFLSLLSRSARAIARAFGCGYVLREESAVLPADGYVFSLPSFFAILSCLLSCVRLYGAEYDVPQMSLREEDGRIVLLLKAQIKGYKDKPSYTIRFDYPEFEACRTIASRHDFILEIGLQPAGETATLSVRFSPEYRDPAVFGLKSPLRFQ